MMLRKTLITLTAVAALGVGSAAMAHGGGGGGDVASFGGRGGWGGGAAMRGAMMGHPVMMRGVIMLGTRSAMVTAPMTGGRVAWGWHDHHFHDHFFHHRFHNRFLAFGFGVPYYYDYGYSSCWTRVWTQHGWQWLYACGDYSG